MQCTQIHTASSGLFPCPNHTLMLPTFSLSIDRRGKRQIVRETGGQANPCMPSAPFNFLSLFHSILCALACSDKLPNSLTHSSLLFSFVRPVQLCAPLFIPQTAHHWREPLPKSHCPTRTPSLSTHTHTHARTHAHTHARTHTHTHTHTHTRARIHTHTHTRTHTHTHSSAAAMVMREGMSKGEGWRAQKEKGRSFSCNSITGGPVFFTNGKSVYLLFFFPPVGFPPCCLRPFSPLASTPPLLTSSFSFKSISHYALKRDVQRCVK